MVEQVVTMTERTPVAWQERNGQRVPVTAQYALAADRSVHFALGAYDHTLPLTIDPTLEYGSYLGGGASPNFGGNDSGNAITLDSAGNIYVTGATGSANFPTANAQQPQNGRVPNPVGYSDTDIFVSKLNPAGTALIYSTYIGANEVDWANAIAVDSSGQVYLTGRTASRAQALFYSPFPLVNAAQTTFGGAWDAFVLKLNAGGSALVFSTYLGGGSFTYGYDEGLGIALDSSGNAYVTGYTASPSFPTTTGAYQPAAGACASTSGLPCYDAFLAKYSPSGAKLYATYLGGGCPTTSPCPSDDYGNALALDSSGAIYLTGQTNTPNFPLVNPLQATNAGATDVFVTKFSAADGSAPVYSTYLGGGSDDKGLGLALDSSNNIYVTGETNYNSTTPFPTTSGAFQRTHSGSSTLDAFVAEIQANGSALSYATYLGGSLADTARAVAVDSAGNATVVGRTTSTNFPLSTVNVLQSTYGGGSADAFITQLNPTGTGLVYSTYLGGSGEDQGNAVVLDSLQYAYLTGYTDSPNFPTMGAFQAARGGGRDAFVAIIDPLDRPPGTRPLGQSFGSTCPVCGQNNASAHDLDPVNLATGNAVWHETDLSVTAPGLPFLWERTYNSRDTRQGALGRGWSLSYDAQLDLSVPDQVTTIAENGAQSIYVISGTQYLRPAGQLANLFQDGDGTYRLVRPDQTVLHFSTSGQLLSTADSAGRTISLTYTSGALSSVTDAVGRNYTITTDAQHRVTSMTDPSIGRSMVYTYTGTLLTDVQDVLGHTAHYSYDTNNYLTAITLPDSSTRVQNQYDSLGRLTWQRAWNTAPFTVTYDLTIPPLYGVPVTRTQILDSLGRSTAYDHDAAGRLRRQIDQDGQETRYQFNNDDQPVHLTDPLSRVVSADYDAQGNLVTSRDGTGQPTTYTYDGGNRVHTEQDALNHTTTYTYTTEGLLQQAVAPLGQQATYTYTQVLLHSGQSTALLTAEEDALGHVTRYAYNDLGQPTVITNTLNQALHLEYDGAGRLTRTVDLAGVAACREYDAADHLTASVANCIPGQPATASQNVRTEYGYDLLGRASWVKNPLGEVTRTFFDSSGNVSQVVAGCTLSGTSSTTTCAAFDPATPEQNRTTTYGYDSLDRQVALTDTLGVVTHTDYDTQDRPWRTIENYRPGQLADASTNVTTTLQYDAAGQVTAQIDALGRKTAYGYDNAGRVLTTTQNYVDGNPTTGAVDSDLITRSEYNSIGLPVTQTLNYVDGAWNASKPDEDQRTVTQYDALSRPITVTVNYVDGVSGGGEIDTDRITTYRYDTGGNLVGLTDPLGRSTVMSYDSLNRLVDTISNCTDGAAHARTSNCATGHGAGNDENLHSSASYTPRGEPATGTDALGRVAHNTYDALGRVVTQVANESGLVAPANVTTQYGYNALGQTTVITDALSAVWQQEYNSAGWLTRQVDATNRAVQTAYDGQGRPIKQTDALNRETHTLYDALGRPTKTVANWQNGVVDSGDGPDQDVTTEQVYDAAGRPVAQIGTDGRRTNYTLDGLDRLTQVVENASGTTTPINVTTVYTYDRRSLVTSMRDVLGHIRKQAYNAMGWQLSATDALTRTLTYTYDKGGRQTQVADPRPKTTAYTYDAQDRLTKINSSGSVTITLGYDIVSRRTAMTDTTGTTGYTYDGLDRVTAAAHSVDGTVSYGYDQLGRRTSLSTSTGAPTLGYGYDAAGRLQSLTRAGQPYASADYNAVGLLQTLTQTVGLVTSYSYDGVNRLTTLNTIANSTALSNFQYTLNRAGQAAAATETRNGTTRTLGYTYDGQARLVEATEQPGHTYAYSYDLVGNRTQVQVDGTTTESRSYDAADQVVGWTYDGAGDLLNDGTNTSTYDALRRMSSVARSGITTTLGYNGDGVLATETTSGTTTRYTLDGIGGLPERLGATTGGTHTWYIRGWGQELSQETGGTSTWYLADRLNSVRGVVNATGTLTTQYDYDPFGNVEGSPSADYGFTGEPQNATTGLVYLRARWYSPAAGRFLTQDPFPGYLTTPQSLHRYAYTNDDPTNLTDPSGQCAPLCTAIGGALLGGGLSFVAQVGGNLINNRPVFSNLDGGAIVSAAVGGAVAGATFGAGTALFGTGLAATVGAGAVSGALGGQVQRATQNAFHGKGLTEGLLNPVDLISDGLGGGLTAGVGAGVGRVLGPYVGKAFIGALKNPGISNAIKAASNSFVGKAISRAAVNWQNKMVAQAIAEFEEITGLKNVTWAGRSRPGGAINLARLFCLRSIQNKPMGAENVLKLPFGLRIARIPLRNQAGTITGWRNGLVRSDLDAAFVLADGMPLSESQYNLLQRIINRKLGDTAIQHGPHVEGMIGGAKGATVELFEQDTVTLIDRFGAADYVTAEGLPTMETAFSFLVKDDPVTSNLYRALTTLAKQR